ncbi:3,4-dihydroxy-2-butanone-4-phosphate synthase [Candidatus Profftella armatura (Diaphorina cf. continua)]|uniref:3,4-dihydroxy-2-butanone 4-phosphate synthase n=1 Tax=Candidatus Profftella armatura (Diaphorina cf. continua) TaxID=2661583 RepID=A0A7R6VYV4_9PROT|nr:3,4-dihydroxy-2-butanone-4-phosphate synthase [Candidatus Profftella armatura (Diaphorina cf. continua)]BCG49589.1 3,4-dihydroxy-2-butanone-4-phosphate synthase [Candidatus Profftella armatura (Diaphorina cf. continua)]
MYNKFISPTKEIISELKMGNMIILVDAENRENEGDIMLSSDFVTPNAINFMAKYARGLICMTLTEEHCIQLKLDMMTKKNNSSFGTNFTVSIEAANEVTTGISASDRAHTIKIASSKKAKPSDIVQPGHIFPLRAKKGGVLVRGGHTEAGCDLTKLAGLTPSAVICEILNDDGTMARLPNLIKFSKFHNIKIGTISDLICYRYQYENIIKRKAEYNINTLYGKFKVIIYLDKINNDIHLTLIHGSITSNKAIPIWLNQPFSILDFLHTKTNSCTQNISSIMKMIKLIKNGILILVNFKNSINYIFNQLKNFNIINEKNNIIQSKDHKDTNLIHINNINAQILKDLNIKKIKLMTHLNDISPFLNLNIKIK